MKKSKTIFVSTLFFLIGLIISSCDKDSTNNLKNPSISGAKTVLTNDNKAFILTRIVAMALENVEFRNILYKEVALSFDNDNDALYASLANQIMELRQQTVENFFIECENNYLSTLNPPQTMTKVDFDNLIACYPDFQLSIPVQFDNWDIDNYVPKVMYIPELFDETIHTQLPAYDSHGDSEILSTLTEPLVPVVVLGSCERMNPNSLALGVDNTLNNLVIDDNEFESIDRSTPVPPSNLTVNSGGAHQLVLEWQINSNDVYQNSIERRTNGTNWTQIATTYGMNNGYIDGNLQAATQYFYRVRSTNSMGNSAYCSSVQYYASDRTEGYRELIKRMKFTDLNAYESWIQGAPEIRVRVGYGTGLTTGWVIGGDFIEPKHRRDINNTWYNWNHALCRWYPNLTNKVWTIHFTEEDGGKVGQEVTFSTSFEHKTDANTTVEIGGSLKFKTGNRDDVITFKPVVWWDPLSDTYDNGQFMWEMDHQY